MSEFWRLMQPAVLASLLMSPVHALFGLHIVRRGLIFIDLAVAQVAALGMSLAVATGHEAQSADAYRYSIVFALVGAFLISLSKFRLGRVPHEALIGVVFVFSTAASMIILTFAPSGHGLEEIQSMLAGNILFVQQGDVDHTKVTYGVILLALLAMWRPIASITLKKDAGRPGWQNVLLDFAFYSLLGFVVASSVKVAGVLVVFSWLVMPAIIAFFFVEKMIAAAAIAIPVGMIGSFLGLYVSYFAKPLDFAHPHEGEIQVAGSQGWPPGPAIVVVMGSMVLLAYLVRLFLPQNKPEEAES